jgi:hypothetical protein
MSEHPATAHHRQAAEQHREAARHHEEAARLYDEGDFRRAAEEAYHALGHRLAAEFHAAEAARGHAADPSTRR